MKKLTRILLLFCLLSAGSLAAIGQTTNRSPRECLSAALAKLVSIVEPADISAAPTFSARLKMVRAEGLPKELLGRTADVAFQAPDHLRLSVEIDRHEYCLGRDAQKLWIYVPNEHFGVCGVPGVARFNAAPEVKDTTHLAPIRLPMPKEQLLLLPLLTKVETQAEELVEGAPCHVLLASAEPQAVTALKLPEGRLRLWLRDSDDLPARVEYDTDKGTHVRVDIEAIQLGAVWPPANPRLTPRPGDPMPEVALSHVTRFLDSLRASLSQRIPTLGAQTGQVRVIATEGQGRLEDHDGTRVLLVDGTPEAMGHQQGVLLKKEIRAVTDRILYGVGVGSSFVKGKWFLGEIESAQKRLLPHMDGRYLREMDALADAAGLEKEEIRLANFFPELFHCSGFALFGEATQGGRMFHGRILDYLRGIGLEQNAVVVVYKPDQGNAWVNIGYAGFIGSVTAMNEKHIAIGEMGGRGEGQWDGKPMAQLVREVMEKASSLDEAVEIMRRGPRTCEYYYVISDGVAKRAVGIAATPTTFETIWPGQSHPQLPHAIRDAVLMSAGDRYEKLAERVQAGYGKFDAAAARELMTRPVCMKSNIHSALFAPDTLDFWVANADSQNVASHARFTHYNLAELLKSAP